MIYFIVLKENLNMTTVVVALAVIGAFTVLAIAASIIAGFVLGAHRRFLRRVFKAFANAAYCVESVLIGIFQGCYYLVTGKKWYRRHEY